MECPAVPTTAERDVAEAALAATPFAPAELLYALVDLIEGSDGRPLLLELELFEPSMFPSLRAGTSRVAVRDGDHSSGQPSRHERP